MDIIKNFPTLHSISMSLKVMIRHVRGKTNSEVNKMLSSEKFIHQSANHDQTNYYKRTKCTPFYDFTPYQSTQRIIKPSLLLSTHGLKYFACG